MTPLELAQHHQWKSEQLRSAYAVEATATVATAEIAAAIHDLGYTIASLAAGPDAPAPERNPKHARDYYDALAQQVRDHLADEDDRATLLQADALLKKLLPVLNEAVFQLFGLRADTSEEGETR